MSYWSSDVFSSYLHFRSGCILPLLVLGRLADAHVDDDLVEPWHRHRICVAALLDKCPADLVVIALLQPGRVFFSHRCAPLSEWLCGPSCRPPSSPIRARVFRSSCPVSPPVKPRSVFPSVPAPPS